MEELGAAAGVLEDEAGGSDDMMEMGWARINWIDQLD